MRSDIVVGTNEVGITEDAGLCCRHHCGEATLADGLEGSGGIKRMRVIRVSREISGEIVGAFGCAPLGQSRVDPCSLFPAFFENGRLVQLETKR